MSRVIVYIDGFNLYFGLKDAGFKRFYWLDLVALATAFVRSGSILEHVRDAGIFSPSYLQSEILAYFTV